jgi:hypothetical protein
MVLEVVVERLGELIDCNHGLVGQVREDERIGCRASRQLGQNG